MNLDCLLEIVDSQLIKSQNRPIHSTEILILQGIWQYRTYNQIAIEAGYSPGYFTNVVAPELFGRLSKIIGQRVTKKNCRVLLEYYATARLAPETIAPETIVPETIVPETIVPETIVPETIVPETIVPEIKDLRQETPPNIDQINQNTSPCYPSGSVPLHSPFYLERSSVEEQINQEIRKPGALIRIKAPREMGKTSLLLRIIDYAKCQGYHTVSLNLEQVEWSILRNLNQFLRWLCANIARQLQRKPMLDEYWDEDLGSGISCTLYLQDYLLESIDTPFILALDEVHQIFEHPQVAKDFLTLLRSWHEEAKRLPIWQKLRLLVIHSTEIYVPLGLDQSPFNVGLPIQLDSFSQSEVQQLAQRYGLDWVDGEEASKLMAMVGGHPALVHLALYHLSRREITMSQLLETATTATGIYHNHLLRHWATLAKQPELAQALDTVLNAIEPVSLDPILTHKLSSMGLIKFSGNFAIAGCELYRRYFTKKGQQHLIYTPSSL